MDISALSALGPDPAALDVTARAQSTREQAEAAGEFESMFVSLLLKEMRKTLQDGMFGGESSDVYGSLFDLHMGQHLAQSDALGIKEMILSEYSHNSAYSQNTTGG